MHYAGDTIKFWIVYKENAFIREVVVEKDSRGGLYTTRGPAYTYANGQNDREKREFTGPDEMRFEYIVAEVVPSEA